MFSILLVVPSQFLLGKTIEQIGFFVLFRYQVEEYNTLTKNIAFRSTLAGTRFTNAKIVSRIKFIDDNY